ncbi:MAG TPA: AsmA family protein [Methylophilaceae bacterium]|nr:AsmA family protein [Methylophilaceae bacterium]
MKKLIKYSLFGLGGLLLLVLIVVAVVAATFNPNDYKPLVVKLVQEKKQRTLHIDGDIKLAFWPKIGADLGKVSLSEHNSDKQFAAINSAKVSLALLPLLKKQLVVDTIYVDGVTANIVRYKDGTTNLDDLMSKDEEESEQIKFDVDGVNVTNSAVNFTDEMAGASYGLSKFNLKTGHVALKEPFDLETDFVVVASQPKVNAAAKIKGNFMADPEDKHFAVKGLDALITGDLVTLSKAEIKLSGDVDAKPENMELLVDSLKLAVAGNLSGAKINAELAAPKLVVQKDEVSGKEAKLTFSQEKGSDVIKAELVLADIKGSPKAVQSSGISGEFSAKQGEHNIQGKFSSPFSGNIDQLIFDLPKLAGSLDVKDPALPNGAMKGDFALKLYADVKKEQVNSDFNLAIDTTKLKGDVAVASFSKPNIKFNLNADQLDLNKLLGAPKANTETKVTSGSAAGADKPADLSALKDLLLQGSVNIGSIIYDKYRLTGLSLVVKADGEQLNIKPFAVKLDDTQIKGGFGISRFAKPIYHFDLDIDKLDADRYITKTEAKPASQPATKADPNAPIDLSALKKINAEGELRIGWLKLANVKSTNVRIKLQADDGVAQLAPFSANLYDGAMNGSLRVDARSTPSIAFKQSMTNIAIGPLLVDAINNDMLSGKGTLNVDVTTQGATVGALKKALGGTAAVNLADGAVKGIDIAGTLRGAKDKLNVLKSQTKVEGDKSKKTDFSEMIASFNIKNGVAHNEDLSMKAPLFRITGNGDIDIASETLNYTAKPTVVASLKGQGGAGLDDLNGLTIPVKLTGTFAKPEYAIDFAGLATALAQKKLLDGVGGTKGEAVKNLIGGNKEDALKSLLGGKKKEAAPADSGATATPTTPVPEQKPESKEDKVKKKLNKLLGL